MSLRLLTRGPATVPDLATVVGAGPARARSQDREDFSHRSAIAVVSINVLLA
jgi:hypothetical protein